jgi:SSS family solute:Na+ symporter
MPFLDQMGYNFLLLSVVIISISLFGTTDKGLELDKKLFKTDMSFNFASLLILGFLAAIYGVFW